MAQDKGERGLPGQDLLARGPVRIAPGEDLERNFVIQEAVFGQPHLSPGLLLELVQQFKSLPQFL